jgi:hypothetical protein
MGLPPILPTAALHGGDQRRSHVKKIAQPKEDQTAQAKGVGGSHSRRQGNKHIRQPLIHEHPSYGHTAIILISITDFLLFEQYFLKIFHKKYRFFYTTQKISKTFRKNSKKHLKNTP